MVFDRLLQRNVHRVAIAYLAGGWLLVQIVDTLLPAFGWPASLLRNLVILLAIGFIPALILAWAFEWTPEGFRRERQQPSRAPDSKYFDRFITVILVIAVAYFAVDKFLIDPARDDAKIAAATEQTRIQVLSGAFADEFKDRSILVLPFLNLSTDPEQAYFADGITEELLNLLARQSELRVISRTTSWTFKDREVDVAEIHRQLDVSHILEGSVRKAGDQVRITAQLIDARTDTHIWSNTFDRTFDDVFAIQDEISVAVADKLHLELNFPDSPHEGIDPKAYELYLRASAIDPTISDEPVEQQRQVERLLEEAIEIEPEYLQAIYDLASAIDQSVVRMTAEEQKVAQQNVTRLVDRLVELAPDSVYANNWRAYMAMRWHDNIVAAAPYLENVMRFANRTDVHVWFRGVIDLLHRLGRNEEAMVVAQYWVNRDPACGYCVAGIAGALRTAGRHKEAAQVMESLAEWRELGPAGFWNTGVAFLVSGDANKALHYFDQIDENFTGMDRDVARAYALYSLGRTEEFEEILARQLATGSTPESIARLYAWSEQPDEAFKWLELMVEEFGAAEAKGIKTDLYEPIKSDPRWQAFLEKYDAEDEPLLDIAFDPEYPPALRRAVDAAVQAR